MELKELNPLLDKLPMVCSHRTLYGEVDRMNQVYGSHYLTWFEHGRNEYLRLCDLPYTEIEERGLILPVVESHVWHLAPLNYDDLVVIRCAIVSCTKVTATFVFLLEHDHRRVAVGYTLHACLDATRKPARLPEWLTKRILQRYDVRP